MNNLTIFINVFLVSSATTFFVTKKLIGLFNNIGLIDDPQKNKHPKVIHTVATPRGGAVGIFIGLVLALIIFIPLDQHLKAIILGLLVVTITGVLDDKYNLHPYIRLFLQFLAASFPILSGVGINFITNPLGGLVDLSSPSYTIFLFGQERVFSPVADIFALLWMVSLMNFINMGAKGVPGQLPGVTAIASLVIGVLSLKFSADIAEWPIFILSAATCGAFLGFLPLNMFPQKIMPGYGGSSIAGYMLSIMSILTTAKVGTLIVVLAIPLIDTTYTIVRRLSRKKSPVWGDRGHLHHNLLDKLSWSQKKVAFFYWTTTAILGLIALNISAENKLYIIIGIALFLGGLLIWLKTRFQK